MEKYNRPENCNNLSNPKVNEEIWEDAFPYMRRNDGAMRKAISHLTKGMIPLIQVIDSCVTAAKNGDKVDIKSTISSGNDALRLLVAMWKWTALENKASVLCWKENITNLLTSLKLQIFYLVMTCQNR